MPVEKITNDIHTARRYIMFRKDGTKYIRILPPFERGDIWKGSVKESRND
jgi:hypothetical protein